MALQTTALLSVIVVALSIVAHQSDPEIIPSALTQAIDSFNSLSKKLSHYYGKYVTNFFDSIGLKSFSSILTSGCTAGEDKGGVNPHASKNNRDTANKDTVSKKQENLLTKEQLKEYNGEEGSKGVYVAILGSVFDVQSGMKHYGPGGGYHFFAGRDGSRAFISGDFTESGLVDDITGLSPKDLKALRDWVDFYHKDYKYVGKLVGRFYDANGKRTADLKSVYRAVKEFERDEARTKEQHKTYPPCNVEWNKDRGSRVWCSTKSGGIVREWAGVPRQLFEGSGKKSRCTCVQPETAVTDPRLKEFEDCPPGADSCWVPESNSSPKKKMSAAKQLVALDFEVFGRVQGVFFRKYTVQTGKKLGLRGWCMNTHHGSVLGQMEGETAAVSEMKQWLSTVGSPSSKIDRAEFRNERSIEKFSFEGFSVHH